MKKLIRQSFLFLTLLCASYTLFAQEKAVDIDASFKENLYSKYKKEVLAYDRKKFDDLFFEFFSKQSDSKLILTKEEYYTYTIKIAIYSEKLGLLYKNQKEESLNAKQEWFDKKYQDYINEKK